MTTCRISLTTLKSKKQQEHSLLAGGDEPYFVIVGFRSTIGKSDSTKVWLNKYKNDDWADAIEKGEKKKIPTKMGRCEFKDIRLITKSELVDGQLMPEIVGCIALCLESDNMSWSDVELVVDRTKAALEKEIRSAIEELHIFPTDPFASIGHAINRVKDAALEKDLPLIWALIKALGDREDFIGHHALVFACVDETLAPMIQAFGGKDLTAGPIKQISKLALQFKGEGAHYQVAARVDIV